MLLREAIKDSLTRQGTAEHDSPHNPPQTHKNSISTNLDAHQVSLQVLGFAMATQNRQDGVMCMPCTKGRSVTFWPP